MRELFSCRNCVHNAGQSLHIGRGQGYCMKHASLLVDPKDTTCKYQHRKDLPHFVVDEGRSEHAGEFAGFSELVSLSGHEPIRKTAYSEKYSWEHRQFDPVNNTLANYSRVKGKQWVLVQSFAGGIDGRRSLVHASLVRGYLDSSGTWTSTYRMALALVQQMTEPAQFPKQQLDLTDGEDEEAAREEARWDLFFTQLSGLQEYGWHAGLENLRWASDEVSGGLAELDWEQVELDLAVTCPRWMESIIRHAQEHNEFFTQLSREEEAV
jgi:hypothetical protein